MLDKIINTIVIIAGVFLLLYFTNPKYDYHKVEISNYLVKERNLGEELAGDAKGDEDWRELIDGVAGEFHDFVLWHDELFIDNYYLFSLGRIKRQNNKIVSLGIIGKVFIIDKLINSK
jgi:hypothetical protein|tara:strand:- start:199 stop:552 length:354 start_codon:yes stop_codon:yes gene_type:complete